MELRGVAVSAGVGIGTVFRVLPATLDFSHVVPGTPEEEQNRLDGAVAAFGSRTQALADAAREKAGDHQAGILEGQLLMLSDPSLRKQLTEKIAAGESAEEAVDGVCRSFADLFAATGDPLMAQRAADVEDMRVRLLSLLLGVKETDLSALPAGTVVVAEELTPSMATALDVDRVTAVVAEGGGFTSHAAILARAMGLPAVFHVPDALAAMVEGDTVAVDGETGVVLVSPTPEELAAFEAKWDALLADKAALEGFRGKPTATIDGRRVRLCGNIGSTTDAQAVAEADGEGVGLFRTEFLYMERKAPPTEEEQFEAYRTVAETFSQGEVTLRTLDAGGDKEVPCLSFPREDNPFLGHRALRWCLDHPDVFSTQLRAALRASAYGQVRVMLPLVTRLSELREAKKLLEEQKKALEREGVPYRRDLPLGVMIETPAAVLMADALAQEADFFSIGTNDLTQYLLCADRGNPAVAEIGIPCDPAVLRSVEHVIAAGHAGGIPVGMCGEAAADPLLIPVWLSFGLDEFSVSPSRVLSTRREIARWDRKSADKVAEGVMELDTAEEVRDYLSAVRS